MPRVAKKLCQVALGDTATAVYTAPDGGKTQVSEIWLANTGDTARTVAIYAHGTDTVNLLVPGVEVAAYGTQIIDGSKIILGSEEVLAGKQDTGTDVILTAYGIEEGGA